MTTRLSAIDFTPDIAKLTQDFTGRQWVFDDIDRWLKESEERFFILTGEPGVGKSAIAAKLIQQRQAQQDLAAYHFCIARQISTIEPDNVLFSLAAQLINFFPDYAEALVNTIKPLHLSVDVEINIGTLKDSVVQGVVIENLHTQHPKKSFDIILRQTLSALPNPPKKPILILIDSLDEAVTYSEEDNLVRLFSQVNDLPSWVRLVFTSRLDERRVLSHFKTLKPYHYHLDELSKKSLEDIHTYVDDRVKTASVQGQLQKYKVASTDLVEQLTELSKGNFLYTKVLLDDISSGGQPLDKENLAKLPKSLGEFYHTFLERRVEAEWEGKYQLIFKILTVTKAPITEEELANLVSEKLLEAELKQRLLVVQQFLNVKQDDWDKKTYALFHQSLRDYLVDGEESGVFYCSPKDGHRQIVDYYWQYQEDPRSWQECDAYGLQFLAPHLVDLAALEKPPIKGRKYIERLHELLATEVDGHNAWFVAKDRIGDTAGFLADVELAWSQADEAYDREPGRSIGLQCRYALIKASINSSAELPIGLMIALVKHQCWKPSKALAYARQMPEPEERTKSLTALACQLPDSELLKIQVLQLALQAASAMTAKAELSPPACAQALIELIDKLPSDLLPQALNVALAIDSSSWGMYSDFSRVKALTALADKLPEIIPSVLDAALEIQDEKDRAEALIGLADKLPEILPRALDAALKIQNEYSCADALVRLADKLPSDLLPQTIDNALEMQSDYCCVQVLTAIADKLPEILPQALEAAQAIQDERYRAQALTALADKLPEILPQALEAALSITSKDWRNHVFFQLAPKLTPDLLPQALETAQVVQDVTERAYILRSLADKLPETLPYALDTALAIEVESSRAEVLTNLAPLLTPNLLPKVLKAAQAFQDASYRAKVFIALADKLPEALPYALDAALAIQDARYRTNTLTRLADKLPEALPHALDAALAIQDVHHRAEALTTLASKLTPDLQSQALDAALAFENHYYRVLVLMELSDKLPEVLPEALKAALEIQERSFRADALTLLAGKLPDILPQALNAALAVEASDDRVSILIKLADKLPPNLMPQVLDAALLVGVVGEFDRARAIAGLADKLPPDLLPQALDAALAIQGVPDRAKALTALADKVPEALFKALDAALAIYGDADRAPILRDLAAKLSLDLLPKALESAQTIEKWYDRRMVLWELSLHFVNTPDHLTLWTNLLHFCSYRTRPNLMWDLDHLIPALNTLGGEGAIAETVQAIQDVSRWWP